MDPVAFMTPGTTSARPFANTAFGTVLTLAAVSLLLGAGVLAVSRVTGTGGQGRAVKTSFPTILPHRRKRATANGGDAGTGAGETVALPRGLVRFDDVAGVDEAKLELGML
jgi:hypothetical protein